MTFWKPLLIENAVGAMMVHNWSIQFKESKEKKTIFEYYAILQGSGAAFVDDEPRLAVDFKMIVADEIFLQNICFA